jgi:hypothetical protein
MLIFYFFTLLKILLLKKELVSKNLVPKGGLEPPHPCEYMDLNHARLPIPPLRRCVPVFSLDGQSTRTESLVLQTWPSVSIP